MSAASEPLCSAALARRSARSMLPRASDCTGTTRRPAITALAGFGPCADVGTRQVVRCPSPHHLSDPDVGAWDEPRERGDRKSTRLNSSHLVISYAVFC